MISRIKVSSTLVKATAATMGMPERPRTAGRFRWRIRSSGEFFPIIELSKIFSSGRGKLEVVVFEFLTIKQNAYE